MRGLFSILRNISGYHFPKSSLGTYVYKILHRVLGEPWGDAAEISLELKTWHAFTSEGRHSRMG